MSWYRATDTTPDPQILDCLIAGQIARPRLEAVTDERFPGRPPHTKSTTQHQHAVLHCVVFTDGKGACRIDGRLHECRPGDCLLVDAMQPHQFGDLAKTPSRYRAITISVIDEYQQALTSTWSQWLTTLCGYRCQQAPTPHRLPAADFQRFLERQRSLIDILCATQGCNWFAAQRCLLDILALVANGPLNMQVSTTGNDALHLAHTTIEQQYHQRLPVADLAHTAGLSAGRFHDCFKQRFGISPTALQMQLRIRAAQTLLASSSLPCKAIAERVGFADTAAFSKAFKKHCGLSPKIWRERN